MKSTPTKMQSSFRSSVWIFLAMAACPGYVYAINAASGNTVTAQAVDELNAKAKRGDAEAQYELANRYSNGQGVAMDKALAFQLYTASAERGLPKAQYELAKYYNGANGDRFDPEQAFAYTEKAAKLGHVPAQIDLAFIYYNGNAKVPKNLPLSFQWYRSAAQHGSGVAQCMLGDFYKGGLGGVKQDYAKAFKWYKHTATKQDKCAPKSQFELYVSYESGNGVRKDLNTALTWLKKAAEAGNPQAQRVLGHHYQKGYGVQQDLNLAKLWLKKSREGVAPHDDHEHDDHPAHTGHEYCTTVPTQSFASFRPSFPMNSGVKTGQN